MFRRRQTTMAKQGNGDHDEGNYPSLQLQVNGSNVSYRFPANLEQPLRHMVTLLDRDQQLSQRVSVVSALRHEGVSLLSLALAATMAHDLSRTICFVDLNWWWPNSFMRELATCSPGIMTLLRGEVNWDQALVRTSLPNLAILPAGNLRPEERPVVARSAALRALIEGLSKSVDHLILDVPAILKTSDAIPLASLGNACCVVVQQGVSSRTAVSQALDQIKHLPMLGVAMNRVQVKTPRWLLHWIPQE